MGGKKDKKSKKSKKSHGVAANPVYSYPGFAPYWPQQMAPVAPAPVPVAVPPVAPPAPPTAVYPGVHLSKFLCITV